MDENMQTIPALDPLEDDFANTRPSDDLFDDEIVPNTSPPKQEPVIPTGPRAHNNDRGGRGRGGGRGGRGNRGDGPRGGRSRGGPRGGGGGGGRGNGRGAPANTEWKGDNSGTSSITSRHAPQQTASAPAATAAAAPPPPPAKTTTTPPDTTAKEEPAEAEPVTEAATTTAEATTTVETAEPTTEDAATTTTEETATATPPTGPAAGTPRKEFPLRNRIATGGPSRQKLTEEELASRMEAARLRNQARTEKHNRAAEDEEKFNAAEQVRKVEEAKKRAADRKKSVEDGKRKKELDAEREQNRQRKLKALSNREWDVSKNEEDYNPSNYTNRSRRGAHGGISGGVISNPDAGYSREGEAEEQEFDGDRSYGGRGRGRGGRGRGRGDRGGGRGDRGGRGGGHHGPKTDTLKADIANEAEFPSLPASKPKVKTNIPATAAAAEPTPVEPETPKGTWAEQAQDAADKAEKTTETPAPEATTST